MKISTSLSGHSNYVDPKTLSPFSKSNKRKSRRQTSQEDQKEEGSQCSKETNERLFLVPVK